MFVRFLNIPLNHWSHPLAISQLWLVEKSIPKLLYDWNIDLICANLFAANVPILYHLYTPWDFDEILYKFFLKYFEILMKLQRLSA